MNSSMSDIKGYLGTSNTDQKALAVYKAKELSTGADTICTSH